MISDFKTRQKNVPERRFKRGPGIRPYARFAGYVLVAAGLAAGGFAGYRKAAGFIGTSRIFALRQVGIKGYEHVLPTEIIRASGLRMGENIFAVPLRSVRANILSIPWIDSVSIRKSPPHSIDITVGERKVYCMILLGRLYYVDGQGIIFKQVDSNDSTNYPVITGFAFRHENFIDTPLQPVIDATAFIRALDHDSMIVGKDISELHVDGTGYTLITTDGLMIRFGRSDLDARIDKLNGLMRYFGERMQMVSLVDLRFAGMGVLRARTGVLPEDGVQGPDSTPLTGGADGVNPLKEVNSSAKKG